MNPWWLLLIVPASAFLGFLASCLLNMAACQGCKEADTEKLVKDGLKEGFLKLTEVG